MNEWAIEWVNEWERERERQSESESESERVSVTGDGVEKEDWRGINGTEAKAPFLKDV